MPLFSSRRLAALMLLQCLVLVTGAAWAGERWVARGSGTLVIDHEGRVAELSLEHRLGKDVAKVVENTIRSWRFEPIIEDGRAVQAEGHFGIVLEARYNDKGEAESLAISDVDFYTPKGMHDPDALVEDVKALRYPTRMIQRGLGASVELVVEIDSAGAVLRSAADKVELYAHGDRISGVEAAVTTFVEASQRSVEQWRFRASSEGQVRRVRVPISYTLDKPWLRVHPVVIQPEPWTLQGDLAAVTELGAGGATADLRIKLLSQTTDAGG
jgi:hypothetical protein